MRRRITSKNPLWPLIRCLRLAGARAEAPRTPSSLLPVAASFLLALAPGPASAIDLSEHFGRLQERQYFVRVGLIEDSSVARVVPETDFRLHDRHGKALYTGTAKTPIRFTCRDAAPARTVYYYLLDAFRPEDRAKAEKQAAAARSRLSLPALVMDDPRVEIAPAPLTGAPPKPSPLVVAVGPYPSRESAGQAESLVSAHYQAELVQTVETAVQGWVEARDAGGNLLAEANGYLGVRPNDHSALIRASALNPGDSRWSESRSWGKSQTYRGLVEIWINPKGGLSVVNHVFIEHYLYGVVPPEIGGDAPYETQKVQAVISRSGAIHKLGLQRHAGWHFDLCDEQHCQVYNGALAEDDSATAAVNATWGQVCTHGNGIIDAVYSLSCGGVTAGAAVWEGDAPYLKGCFDAPTNPQRLDFRLSADVEKWIGSSPDVFCNPNQKGYPQHAAKYFRWERKYTAAQLAENLRKADCGLTDKVLNISVLHRTPTGRVDKVRVEANPTGRAIILTQEFKIRQALGGLPSTLFTLERQKSKSGHLASVTIKGAGCGHGVGLCQVGALMMARRGYDYITILKHYYRDIDVYRIYR